MVLLDRKSKQVLSKIDRAERMHEHSRLSRMTCVYIVSAFTSDDNRKLSVQAEKNLLTADQNESLKDRGLTVFDCIIGDFEVYDSGFVIEMFAEWNERLGDKIFLAAVEV